MFKIESNINKWVLQVCQSLVEYKKDSEVGYYQASTLAAACSSH